jgi:hypothetical protein
MRGWCVRACVRAVIGVSLAFSLAACGRPDVPRPTTTPATRPVVQLACFGPLDAVPGVRAPRIAQDAADAAAAERGALPDRLAQPLRRGGVDALANREVWLLSCMVARVEPGSSLRAGATVSILIDAQNAAPVIACREGR